MQDSEPDHSQWVGLIVLGVIIWVIWSAWNNSRYTKEYWVYACPQDDRSSKCYKVLSDYETGGCYGDSGECDPPTIYTIYFENGGWLEMDCSYSKKDTWDCNATNDDNSNWELQIAEVKKIPK